MSTGVIWSKSKPDVEFQYGERLGEFNGMPSQSHVSRCRVLPLGKFTVMFPERHATLQGVRIPSAILKIVFRHILCYYCFFKCSFGFGERRLSYRLRYTCLYAAYSPGVLRCRMLPVTPRISGRSTRVPFASRVFL